MNRPEGALPVGSFYPSKKKAVTRKAHHRTPQEKRERIWGKTPQKPYISSSLGDMARVMMRVSCMENSYFYNPEPPAVEFYDFWQKFSVDNSNDPTEFVDLKRVSIANLKKNTSSFDFFGNYTTPIRSSHDMETAGEQLKTKKKAAAGQAKLSDIWKDVRISMSTESFISSSTKVSQDASVVPMETGWDSDCTDDYQSSESDFGFDFQDRCRHHLHKQHWVPEEKDENKHSSIEFHTPQGLIEKQANAIAQSILAMQKRDNKILYELATRPRDLDLIDHFADDLDDSFLADAFSYRDLPDEVFGPDFDFLNEDVVYKRGKRTKKAKAAGKHAGTTVSTENAGGDDFFDEEEEGEGEENKKRGEGETASLLETAQCSDSDSECQKIIKSKVKGTSGPQKGNARQKGNKKGNIDDVVC